MSYKQNWCHGVSHVFCNYSWEQTLHNAIQSYLALHILLTVCSHFLRLLRVLPHYQCSSPPLLSPFSRRCAIFLTFDITSLWVPSLCYAYNDYCSLNMQHIVFNHLQCTKKSLPPPHPIHSCPCTMIVLYIKRIAHKCSTSGLWPLRILCFLNYTIFNILLVF